MDEEVEVVNSIYEGCLTKWADNIYTVQVPDSLVSFRMSLGGYPDSVPKIYDSGKWQKRFTEILNGVFIPGEETIFSFISEVKQALDEEQEGPEPINEPVLEQSSTTGSQYIDDWVLGQEIKDRGSTFVARCKKVSSEAEALEMIADLVQDKRLARASHNMSAWRIVNGDLVTRNCDDDGETAAGSRMLHLLDITDCRDAVVVVSRWFGGTHLGPARFKHINTCARDALQQGKFINN